MTACCGTLAATGGPSHFGSIVGTVRNPSGGVVPGCQITVHQETTSARCTTLSDQQGSYCVANLEPGTYTVGMEARGFQRATCTGIELLAQQTIRVDGCVTPTAPSASDHGRAASEQESNLEVSHPTETRTPFAALEQPPRETGRAASWFDRDADLDWVGEEMGEPIFHALSNLLPRVSLQINRDCGEGENVCFDASALSLHNVDCQAIGIRQLEFKELTIPVCRGPLSQTARLPYKRKRD